MILAFNWWKYREWESDKESNPGRQNRHDRQIRVEGSLMAGDNMAWVLNQSGFVITFP